MDKELLKDKIRKLLALGERGGTEHEAAVAMSKVQSLLAQHKLNLEELGELDEDAVTEEVFLYRYTNWRLLLARAAARLCFCLPLITGNRRLTLIGKPTDLIAAKYVYENLVSACDRQAKRMPGGRQFKGSWRLGFAHKVNERVELMIAQAKNNQLKDSETGTELILKSVFDQIEKEINDYLRKKHGRVRPHRLGNSINDPDAAQLGYSAGEKVPLTKHGISGRAPKGICYG